jgi:hypothetical protein
MSKKVEVKWLETPEEHDYPAALSYLRLIYDDQTVAETVEKLRAAPMTVFKAKDIFRASNLPLLGISNERVEHDQKKIKKDIPLSPLLLVRDTNNGKVVIADGYHRLCALYSYEEDSLIPCKIV